MKKVISIVLVTILFMGATGIGATKEMSKLEKARLNKLTEKQQSQYEKVMSHFRYFEKNKDKIEDALIENGAYNERLTGKSIIVEKIKDEKDLTKQIKKYIKDNYSLLEKYKLEDMEKQITEFFKYWMDENISVTTYNQEVGVGVHYQFDFIREDLGK